MGCKKHRKDAPRSVSMAVISVSSTRKTTDDDESGNWIKIAAGEKGHKIVYHGMADDDRIVIKDRLIEVIESRRPDAVIVTGGTGLAKKDVTIEAVSPLFEKELSAFKTIFAMLSFEEITSAAILSRAAAGIYKTAAIFCIPGSIKACRLACERIIFPEVGHIIKHIRED